MQNADGISISTVDIISLTVAREICHCPIPTGVGDNVSLYVFVFYVDEFANFVQTIGGTLGQRPGITEILANGVPA
jgi:hypothetical protein